MPGWRLLTASFEWWMYISNESVRQGFKYLAICNTLLLLECAWSSDKRLCPKRCTWSMSPLRTIDTTQTGGPGASTSPSTSPQGEITCGKLSLTQRVSISSDFLPFLEPRWAALPGPLLPKCASVDHPADKNTAISWPLLIWSFRAFPTIWNSFVGRSLSLILVRRKVTAREWITVHAGWCGEMEPGGGRK